MKYFQNFAFDLFISSAITLAPLTFALSLSLPEKALGEDFKFIEANNLVAQLVNDHEAETYYDRGLNYFVMEEYDKALVEFNQAITINPQFADAYNNRGMTYAQLQQYDKALAEFNQAIAISPQFALVY